MPGIALSNKERHTGDEPYSTCNLVSQVPQSSPSDEHISD